MKAAKISRDDAKDLVKSLKKEGRENLLPYAGLVFNAFGPPNPVVRPIVA